MSAGTLSPSTTNTTNGYQQNPLTNSVDRESQIRAAAQEMVKGRERWSQSEEQYFPEWLETTISASLNIILQGDVPSRCVPLYQAAVLLASQWERIITLGEGVLPGSGIPGRIFWDQFDAVTRCLNHVETQKSRYIAPIKQQLEEFSGDPRKYQYVAKNYGWQEETPEGFMWKGPFFVNGSVDVRLIEQELAEPGSVIKPGWHPDDERKKKEQKIVEESGSALARIREHLNRSGVKTESTGSAQSIEKMIRDGQLLGAICRISGAEESEVRAIAKAIGVPVYNKEEYAQMLQEKTAMVKAETAPPMQSGQPIHPAGAPVDSNPATAGKGESSAAGDADSDADGLTPDEFVSAILEANPEITTPEVVTAAKNAGLKVTGQWVGKRLSALRKAAGSAVGAVASSVASAVADSMSGDADSQEPSTSPAETDSDSDSEY